MHHACTKYLDEGRPKKKYKQALVPTRRGRGCLIFQAELEIGRNLENEEHTLPLKFLSHGHGKIRYAFEEVSYIIDQLSRISTKKTKMFEDPPPRLKKKLLQVFFYFTEKIVL